MFQTVALSLLPLTPRVRPRSILKCVFRCDMRYSGSAGSGNGSGWSRIVREVSGVRGGSMEIKVIGGNIYRIEYIFWRNTRRVGYFPGPETGRTGPETDRVGRGKSGKCRRPAEDGRAYRFRMGNIDEGTKIGGCHKRSRKVGLT